jgi:hypothetical protein
VARYRKWKLRKSEWNLGKLLKREKQRRTCRRPWPKEGEKEMSEMSEYEKHLEATIKMSVDILDGNAEPIDWRDTQYPELLRKLCEHLEVIEDADIKIDRKMLALEVKNKELREALEECYTEQDENTGFAYCKVCHACITTTKHEDGCLVAKAMEHEETEAENIRSTAKVEPKRPNWTCAQCGWYGDEDTEGVCCGECSAFFGKPVSSDNPACCQFSNSGKLPPE